MGQVTPSSDRFVFTSSVADEAWQSDKPSEACEWWYFDALSDDGNEAVTVVFLDNFTLGSGAGRRSTNGNAHNGKDPSPLVAFTYFAGGKAVFTARSQFAADDLSASSSKPKCRIGPNGFRFDSASYGSGYLVSVDLPLARGRRLRANLEWLSIEADLEPRTAPTLSTQHLWNMVAPRCDVSGKITIEDPRGHRTEVYSFRGTGYHDHHRDWGWISSTAKSWHWGRAHFADSTAVFCTFSEGDDRKSRSQLLLTGDLGLQLLDTTPDDRDDRRNRGGRNLRLNALHGEEEYRLDARILKTIDSNFYTQRHLSQITLNVNGREHSVSGITERIAPRALRYRWLRWLSGLRRN